MRPVDAMGCMMVHDCRIELPSIRCSDLVNVLVLILTQSCGFLIEYLYR